MIITNQYNRFRYIKPNSNNYIDKGHFTVKQVQPSIMKNYSKFNPNQTNNTYCKNIDFRNAKFQGKVMVQNPTHKNTNSTFGCAIDYNYTWICAQWLNNHISGPIAAIFADSSKIYGCILSEDDIENCCNPQLTVCEGQFYKIYLKRDILVVDVHTYGEIQYNILAKFIIHTHREEENDKQDGSRRANLKESPNYNKLNKFNKKLQYICQKQYLVNSKSYPEINFQKSYIKILQQLLKSQQLDVNKINFELFLKNNQPFTQNIQLTHTIHEKVNDNKKQNHEFITIGWKNKYQFSSNLLLKLFKNQDNKLLQQHKCTQKYQLLKISSIDQNYNQQIIKRYQYYANNEGYLVEECVFKNDNQVIGYAEYEYLYNYNKKNRTIADNFYHYIKPNWLKPNHQLYCRPDVQTGKQCIKNLIQHYKKSLNYSNEYINMKPIYTLQCYFIQLLRLALPTIQIQYIKSEKMQKNRQNSNVWRRDSEEMEDYSRISFNDKGNIGKSMANGSRIGQYVIKNQIQGNQFEASLYDIRKEIILIQLRESRRKSRINPKIQPYERQKYEENLMHVNKKRGQQKQQQKQNILVDEDEQQNNWIQKQQRNQNQYKWNKNVQKQKLGDSRQLQTQDMRRNVQGSYIYYFDDETNSNSHTKQIKPNSNKYGDQSNRKNPNTPINRLNNHNSQYNSQLFIGNNRSNTNHNTNYTNNTDNYQHNNEQQLQQLALYYQNIQLQATKNKNNKSNSKTKDKDPKKAKSKSKNKNNSYYNRTHKYESPPKTIPVKIGKQTPTRTKNRQNTSNTNKNKYKQKKAMGSPLSNRIYDNQIGFHEQEIYKYPRQNSPQAFDMEQASFNTNRNIKNNQKKQGSKISKFFKYTPQSTNRKGKNSYLLGK